MSDAAKCEVCGSTDAVQRYAITIDGEPLRLAPQLCQEHGERFIYRHGIVLGTLLRELGAVFLPPGADVLERAFPKG